MIITDLTACGLGLKDPAPKVALEYTKPLKGHVYMKAITPVAVLLAKGGNGDDNSLPGFVQFLGAGIFILVGLLNLFKPDVGWRLSKWQYRNQNALQPSAAGLVLARITGAGAVVVGIVLLVLGVNR